MSWHYLAVAGGGALGAMARFWVYNVLLRWSASGFPWATLSVNVLGSLLLGLVFVLLTERLPAPAELRSFIAVGFLGAFTTFSTFSVDALSLFHQGAWSMALMYVLGSVVLCLGAAATGLCLARWLF